jgi:hypothetical protein
MTAEQPLPLWRMAKLIRVVRTRAGAASFMEIDGEVFPYFTADGFTVHPQRNQMPSVTFTVLANRVEVIDDARSHPDVD